MRSLRFERIDRRLHGTLHRGSRAWGSHNVHVVDIHLGLLEVDTGHTDIQLPCPGYHPKPGEEVVRMHTHGVSVYLPAISLKVI